MSRVPGLSWKVAALTASAFAVLIVGSGILKTRHLVQVAERVAWAGPDFRVDRPEYDRLAFEQTAARDGKARVLFRDGMSRFLHADDKGAQARFLKALAREPEWPMLRFYLGVTRLLLGFPVAAAADLQAAEDAGFDPPRSRTAWWLGLARLYCGRNEDGYRLLERVAAVDVPQAPRAREILTRLQPSPEDSPR